MVTIDHDTVLRARVLLGSGRPSRAELVGAYRVLAEEGRFREAAELDEEAARNGIPDHSFWKMVRWAANLEGAGLHDAASTVFRELLEKSWREAAEQRTALAILTGETARGRPAARAGRRPTQNRHPRGRPRG